MKTRINRITAVALILALGSVVANAAPILGPVEVGANGHFYQFVEDSGVAWDDANTAANGLTHLGIQGHLATITSAAESIDIESLRLAWVADDGGVNGELYVGGHQSPASADPSSFFRIKSPIILTILKLSRFCRY